MVRSNCLKRSCRVVLCLTWVLPLWFGIGQAASAADPSFVGVLALAVDKDVADRLGLSDEARGRLRQLVNEREDAALEIVLSIKDLPPMEQTARLTPFVEESERLGFALLTVAQREKLRQIRLAREGMSALAEPGLSESLSLSGEQKAAVQQVVGSAGRGPDQRRRKRAADHSRGVRAQAGVDPERLAAGDLGDALWAVGRSGERAQRTDCRRNQTTRRYRPARPRNPP